MKKINNKRVIGIVTLFLFTVCKAQTITTVAGTGEPGKTGDGDVAIGAQLNFPYGLGLDALGNLYIGEMYNYRLRKVSDVGIITTIAGNDTLGYSYDTIPAFKARIALPSAIIVDAIKNIYFSDYGNARIRKIDSLGIIRTIGGTGVPGYTGDGGDATLAQINTPSGLAMDGSGNIYFTDRLAAVVRKIDVSGHISTVCGTGTVGFSGDGGPATSAQLNLPHGLSIDGSGNIYIVDEGNNRIRKIDHATGNISTYAGTGVAGFSGDGGAASMAQISQPEGVATDANGNVYISDQGNHRIRKVDSSGNISTLAGIDGRGYGGDEGPANRAGIAGPTGIVATPSGTVYFADSFNNRIRRIQ